MVGEKGAMSSRAVLVGATAGVVVLVAVAGFLLRGNGSDGGEPVVTRTAQASPSLSTSPTPTRSTATPTVAAPLLPDAASKPSRDGAAAFVRYFFEVYNYSYAALDSSILEALSGRDCRYCRAVVDDVAEQKRLGHRFVDGQTEVTQAIAPPGDPEAGVVVNALVRQNAGMTVDADGTVVETNPSVPEKRVDARVVWSGKRWTMSGVQVQGS